MYCPECGNKIEDFSKFCPECGTPIDSSDEINMNTYGEGQNEGPQAVEAKPVESTIENDNHQKRNDEIDIDKLYQPPYDDKTLKAEETVVSSNPVLRKIDDASPKNTKVRIIVIAVIIVLIGVIGFFLWRFLSSDVGNNDFEKFSTEWEPVNTMIHHFRL